MTYKSFCRFIALLNMDVFVHAALVKVENQFRCDRLFKCRPKALVLFVSWCQWNEANWACTVPKRHHHGSLALGREPIMCPGLSSKKRRKKARNLSKPHKIIYYKGICHISVWFLLFFSKFFCFLPLKGTMEKVLGWNKEEK